MFQAYRIVHRKWLDSAFSGEGAKLYGGRWNSLGTPIVYLASTRSLAVLEMLVHTHSAFLKMKYMLIEITFDPGLVQRIKSTNLDPSWQKQPASNASTSIGDKWFQENRSVILSVPSSIIPEEDNYLLNPKHPNFDKIEIKEATEFNFDKRLII